MESQIPLEEFLNNYLHYYQKFSISLILGKPKGFSVWYIMYMKILFLRNDDNIEDDNYLLNNINGKNIKVKFYDFSLDQFNIVNQAIQGKVRIKGDQYNFYNNQTQSKNPYV